MDTHEISPDELKELFNFVPIENKEQNGFLKACYKGKLSQVRAYIRAGKTLRIKDACGRTAIMLAACNSATKSEKVFELVFKKFPEDFFGEIDQFGQNALFYACHVDRFNRVSSLCERGVKVIISTSYGKLARYFAKDLKILQLLEEDSERELQRLTAIIQASIRTHGTNRDLVSEEVFENTGLRMQWWSRKESQDDDQDVVRTLFKKQTFLTHPHTVAEVKETFDSPPRNSGTASRVLKDKFGFSLEIEETKELLAEAGITLQSDILRDRQVLKKLVLHFKENPPKSIKEAGDYIHETYQARPNDKRLREFLEYCGVKDLS